MERKPCPECGHKHAGLFLNRRDVYDVKNCPLFNPNMTAEEESDLFSRYWGHVNDEIDRWKEERHSEGRDNA
jgi:hypothetical protein